MADNNVPVGAPYQFCKTCRDAWPDPPTRHECPDRVRAEVLEPGEWSPAPGVRGTVLYQADGVLVGRVTLEPGAEFCDEPHVEVETVVEVRGAVTVLIDGAWHAGLRTVPSGMKHTICNASATEHAEYIAVIRRA